MKTKFKQGDIIVYCNEEFIVLENNGESGIVKENCENGATIRNFKWNVYGEQCILKAGDTQ